MAGAWRNGGSVTDEIYEADEFDDEAHDLLLTIGRFQQMVERVPWFQDIGKPLSARVENLAHHYLGELGFPDARLAPVHEWEDAVGVAENPDIDSEAWEAEELLRAELSHQAAELWEEETLTMVLEKLTQAVGAVALREAEAAAEINGIRDRAFCEAASLHAVNSAYQAALVLAAQVSDDHPFALKFGLFELGRWPIGITGGSFNLY